MQDVTDADLIAFAAIPWNFRANRMAAIREQFDLTEVRYLQVVNQILDDPKRIAELPAKLWPTVRRLDEMRQRSARRRAPRAS